MRAAMNNLSEQERDLIEMLRGTGPRWGLPDPSARRSGFRLTIDYLDGAWSIDYDFYRPRLGNAPYEDVCKDDTVAPGTGAKHDDGTVRMKVGTTFDETWKSCLGPFDDEDE
jgi:hypothetical protein